jgi:hypothetical protein
MEICFSSLGAVTRSQDGCIPRWLGGAVDGWVNGQADVAHTNGELFLYGIHQSAGYSLHTNPAKFLRTYNSRTDLESKHVSHIPES